MIQLRAGAPSLPPSQNLNKEREYIMAPANPQTVTVYGRLSWPVFSHAEAVARNAKSKFPQPADQVTAEFNLLLDQAQRDKFVTAVKDQFLPYCLQQHAANEKRNALDAKQVDQILRVLEGDLEIQPPYIPLKPVPEKSAELAPDAVAMLKVKGARGADIVQKAIVTDEDQLIIPDPDILTWPVIKPIHQTVHSLYGGCYATATLNLYAYVSGKLPGFSASAGTVVFKADGDRFGGGIEIDEDEIFAD